MVDGREIYMNLADKIIALRKKQGWSQEELADRMDVSRQAVSKWEGGQAMPDVEKILQLADLFEVTTDYLLKDSTDASAAPETEEEEIRRVTHKEATEYLAARVRASLIIALGVFLCIISPIPLIMLTAAFQTTEALGVGLGIGALLAAVAVAVSLFVYSYLKNAPYEYLEKAPFALEYGVEKLVRERQEQFRGRYVVSNVIGVCMCILSPIILIIASLGENSAAVGFALCAMLLTVAVAVFLFVLVGVRYGSTQRLLHEGEYKPKDGARRLLDEAVSTLYWTAITAAYLIWSFSTNDWHITWIVWPIAGVLFSAIESVLKLSKGNKK